MDIITVDFETYYDRDFSLTKLTTEEYIRSDRFESWQSVSLPSAQ